MNYDVDVGPVLITDWYHEEAFKLYHKELDGTLSDPDSFLVNGKGAVRVATLTTLGLGRACLRVCGHRVRPILSRGRTSG